MCQSETILCEWFIVMDVLFVCHSHVNGEGNGTPLQYSCLENPMDGGAWWAAVYGSHRVGHDWSDLAGAAAGYPEKAMATHSSVFALRIPGMVEPDGLPSMGRTESDTTEVT